jgi:phospholipid-transporting ATPase
MSGNSELSFYMVSGLSADICSYKRTYQPAPYHIVQEIQKFNLSDYRPRQEQYVFSTRLRDKADGQIPKGDQEGPSYSAYASSARICVLADRDKQPGSD